MTPVILKKTTPPFSFSLLVLILSSFPLLGCIPGAAGNVEKFNSDTYKISMEGEDSLEMRDKVWQEADVFCQEKKQYFSPVDKTYNQNLYEIEFRCLNAGDPELLEGETPFQEKRYHKRLGGYGEVKY